VYLAVGLFERAGAPDALAECLRAAGLVDTWILRARSLSALIADAPLFGGLRAIATGADEDRWVVVAPLPVTSLEEAKAATAKVETSTRQAELAARWLLLPVSS
jgi:hypothetical protein